MRIGQLEFLEVLFLDNNCLEMIPMEIGNLRKSLKVLKLAHNKLKTLTNRIRDLKNLEILHLQSNHLKSLPENLELPKLTEFILLNNHIEIFNLPLSKMPNLSKIGIDWFGYLLPPIPLIVCKRSESSMSNEFQLNLLNLNKP